MWPAQFKLNALKFRGELTSNECSICMQKFETGAMYTLSCNHSFHKNCISEWLCWKRTCPYCRAVVKENELNELQQYGLERKYGDTQLLQLTFRQNAENSVKTDAFGTALQTPSVEQPIRILLLLELMLKDDDISWFTNLPGDIANVDFNTVVNIAKENLMTEKWDNAFKENYNKKGVPFKIVAQNLNETEHFDEIISETLSIREGALVEWWRLNNERIMILFREVLRDLRG